MENVKHAALLLLLSCGLAHAESEVKTMGDLDRLQGGRVFYDAQAAFNKAKNAANESDPAAVHVASVPANNTVNGNAAPVSAPASVSTLPSLEKVAGAVATLNLSDGSTSQVRAGDSVQGNFKVVSVSMRGVVIKRQTDGRVFTLN